MTNTSIIIAARNLLHDKTDTFKPNETIDFKIESLLAFFLEDYLLEINFSNEGAEATFLYDQEKGTIATLTIKHPIKLYAQLLEYIHEMYYGSSSSKDMIAKKEIMAKQIFLM